MTDQIKITDMTFYQIENMIDDLKHQIDILGWNNNDLQTRLDEWETGEMTATLDATINKLRSNVSSWKQVAASLAEQLLIAQRKLDIYQIGVSPDIEGVLEAYRDVRDRL